MGVQSGSGFEVTETQGIKISQEILRSLLHQIETELLDSEVYHHNLAQLAELFGESGETVKKSLKNVSREAIRLTFRQIAKYYKFSPVVESQPETNSDPQTEVTPEEVTGKNAVIPFTPVIDHEELSDLAKRPLGLTIAPKKPNQAQEAEILEIKWREALINIGIFLKQNRQQARISLDQLHSDTLVPIYHIVALEEGQIEKLPEDIYLRGFIRRLAKALKLDGEALLAYLPIPTTSVIPSWYKSNLTSSSNVPIPLYIGYTALVAGAIGGLSWTLNQNQPSPMVEIESSPLETSVSLSPKHHQETVKPSINATVDIAPPEMLDH
jgi:transcriptional regulator with XRE-family HTH domain